LSFILIHFNLILFYFQQHENLIGYQQYFNAIVGFFVIENHLLYTTNGLVSQAILEEMWTNALPRIADTLRTYSVSSFGLKN
jgi:hypothetical protein